MRNVALALLFVFLVAFPKAGFKVGGVPVTFGYVLLALVTAGAMAFNIAGGRYRAFSWRKWLSLAATIPLQCITLLLVLSIDSVEPSYTLSFVVGFVLLPTTMLLLLMPQLSQIDPRRFEKYLRVCVPFVAVYGIFLFFYLLATGSFIEVPFLTVNAGDVGTLAADKNIDRGGGIFKLISTYNNGNIYGVCMLMLLPFYDLVERSLFWRLVVRLSLMLTLSRTVWFGLAAYELISAVYVRHLTRLTLLYIVAAVAVALAGVLYLLSVLERDVGFLFDANLGGRAAMLESTRAHFLPVDGILFPSEIVYVNVLHGLGVIGLICFLVSVFTPLLIAFLGPQRGARSVRACILGAGMLLICGLSDGPILYIPVMAFFWALTGLALADVPWEAGRQAAPLATRRSEPREPAAPAELPGGSDKIALSPVSPVARQGVSQGAGVGQETAAVWRRNNC